MTVQRVEELSKPVYGTRRSVIMDYSARVIMDYSAPVVFNVLKEKNIGALRTMRMSRRGMVKELQDLSVTLIYM